MTPAQVAKLIGCHPATIRGRIRDGTLKASKSPVRKEQYHVHRDSIIHWLLKSGWDGSQIRKMLPQPGPVCLVGVRPELMPAFSQERPRMFAETLFKAAIDLLESRPWGLVIDLTGVGTANACREAAWYRAYIDRPLLIGLHADDFDTRGSVFDFLIPDSLPPGKIAQRLRGLRPWTGR